MGKWLKIRSRRALCHFFLLEKLLSCFTICSKENEKRYFILRYEKRNTYQFHSFTIKNDFGLCQKVASSDLLFQINYFPILNEFCMMKTAIEAISAIVPLFTFPRLSEKHSFYFKKSGHLSVITCTL